MVTGTDHVYRAIGHPKLPKTSSHRLLFPITSRSPAPYPFRSRIACTSRLASNTRTMAIGLVTGSYTIRYENTDQNLTGNVVRFWRRWPAAGCEASKRKAAVISCNT